MIHSREATDGKQPGDPARAARIIMEIVRLDAPPPRLLLGAFAVESAEKASKARAAEAEKWAAVSRSADSERIPRDNATPVESKTTATA